MVIWIKIVVTIIIALLGWGSVTPQLISMNSDVAVLMGVINGLIIVPYIILVLWRGRL